MGRVETNIKTLVETARLAGLRMDFDGELLRIHGPRKHTAIAKELLNRKAEVIEYLATPAVDENIEMHDSALFAPPVVEVTFYDGSRIQIPQQSTPEGWVPQF